MTSTSVRPRPQPCSHCGENVVIVETRASALGGMWRLSPAVRLEHADFEPDGQNPDQIDGSCRRPRRPTS
jgi:hypothetical protein